MEKNTTVKDFIVENFLFGETSNLTENTDLFKESIMDSTGILELIAFLESTYNIRIEDDEMIQENFNSISSIGKFLDKKNINKTDKICAD